MEPIQLSDSDSDNDVQIISCFLTTNVAQELQENAAVISLLRLMINSNVLNLTDTFENFVITARRLDPLVPCEIISRTWNECVKSGFARCAVEAMVDVQPQSYPSTSNHMSSNGTLDASLRHAMTSNQPESQQNTIDDIQMENLPGPCLIDLTGLNAASTGTIHRLSDPRENFTNWNGPSGMHPGGGMVSTPNSPPPWERSPIHPLALMSFPDLPGEASRPHLYLERPQRLSISNNRTPTWPHLTSMRSSIEVTREQPFTGSPNVVNLSGPSCSHAVVETSIQAPPYTGTRPAPSGSKSGKVDSMQDVPLIIRKMMEDKRKKEASQQSSTSNPPADEQSSSSVESPDEAKGEHLQKKKKRYKHRPMSDSKYKRFLRELKMQKKLEKKKLKKKLLRKLTERMTAVMDSKRSSDDPDNK